MDMFQYIYIYMFVYIYLCVCVRACMCLCVCVLTSFHREGFICLDQLGYQGPDQRRCVEDVGFVCRLPSSPI